MNQSDLIKLKELSFSVREHIITMATNGGCFVGASLSCADLIVYLYSKFLNVNPVNLKDPKRDYFLLSKGHDVPALYGTLAELGFFDKERLKNHLKLNDDFYWHPNRNIPGIEFHSGSLGHLLPVAVGIALDGKIRNYKNKIVVLTGDGELNEGSNWEALLTANAYKLDNLIIIVDRNKFQANLETEDLIPIEPLDKKMESFGCSVKSIDGHGFENMENTFSTIPFEKDKPSVIIAHTTRGKGLPSIENRADRWFCNFSQTEVEELIRELNTHELANITTKPTMVR